MPEPAPSHPVEILDVTIRDGSYTIDFQFTAADIRFLCKTLEEVGFRYIEVGHGFGLNAAAAKGASAGTDDEYLAAAAESLHQAAFGTFFIPGIGRKEDLRRARENFGMHFVRIGDEPDRIETSAVEYIEYAKELGYEVMANFMKTYAVTPRELAAKAKFLRAHGCDAIYIVDSAGGMLPGEVAAYTRAVAEACDARIGFHGHNNLELASANTIAAYENGCTLLDCSIGGLGRSSGNTRSEMLIPALWRMGVKLDYDLLGITHVLDTFIATILRRKSASSVNIASGYALVHSGMMKPFEAMAAKHGVGVKELLLAYGQARPAVGVAKDLEPLAATLAATPSPWRAASTKEDNVLLQIGKEQAEAWNIQCSFMAVEKLLAALNALSRKASLPIVLLVRIEPVSADDSYIMAEYLYHDDYFIVARALFSSAAEFCRFIDRHDKAVDVVAFENLPEAAKAPLAGRLEQLRRNAAVLHLNRLSANYHYLLGLLYSAVQETSAKNVLLVGANAEEFALHLPPEMAHENYYCAFHEREGVQPLRYFRLDLPSAHVLRDMAADDLEFEVGILFSHVSPTELAAVLDRLGSNGVLLNCAGHAGVDTAAIARRGVRHVAIDLPRSVSGELISLLRAERGALPSSREDALPGAAIVHYPAVEPADVAAAPIKGKKKRSKAA